MKQLMILGAILGAAAALGALAAPGASAQENYAAWAPLKSTFESTGGGGITIKGYDPVIANAKCVTSFMAVEPGANGKVYFNIVEFDAVPEQGGTLCSGGKWRAADGSMSGTTPLRLFFKDGTFRRSP